MSIKLMVMVLLLLKTVEVMNTDKTSFIYNDGFQLANLTMDGVSKVTSNGLLQLTNNTNEAIGHAFYPNPIVFKNSSFSTTFISAIRSEISAIGGQAMAFVISPTKKLYGASALEYIGLFNNTSNGNPKNHIFAVELDVVKSSELGDINNNHVGININGANSTISTPAGYYDEGFQFQNLSLISGHSVQLWVDYDEGKRKISVTLAPINVNKPKTPLLTLSRDLSQILSNPVYVGFSSSTGSRVTSSFYVLGWSFQLNGEAQNLVISKLPSLPLLGTKRKSSLILPIGLPLIPACLIVLMSLAIFIFIMRKKKFSEVLEEWEQDYGPHRFKYKDLYFATKGFREKELLGRGGFGRVYKGVLPISKMEIAVKKVSHDSEQGMREFIAEIVSIGRLRHRNIIPLLGYCRRKGELLLVYDFMSNGSLDKYLFNQPKVTLNWTQRFHIIKGVASGLCYLHEEWEQVVVHRDIKASNVLLDSELNGRLGDFGLARLYDHGSDPTTTHLVGTIGYLAPEQTIIGRATTRSDVFAFGVFLLEVVCGRRPIEQGGGSDVVHLVHYVYNCLNRGDIVEAKDENLGTDYRTDEVELVLKLGLMCSNSEPLERPSMRQVVQYLYWEVSLPYLCSLSLSSSRLTFGHDQEFLFSSVVESVLSGGR